MLNGNLSALRAVDAGLVTRLGWAAGSDHVVTDAAGGLCYRVGLSQAPLALTGAQVDAALAGCGDGPVLLTGLGLGELAAALLAGGRRAPVVAWERDPWLLRLALERHDLRGPLRDGRLRLLLGTDLLEEVRRGALEGHAEVAHPLLGQVYRRERGLLSPGVAARPLALVAAGGLFVDDLARGLERAGYATATLDLSGLSHQELQRSVQRTRPALLAAVNYTEGLAEFAASLGLRALVWEIDPSTSRLERCQASTARTFVFTFRRAAVEEYRAAGFTQVEWLPLASDPDRRTPVTLDAEERRRYGAEVSIVGSSLVEQVPRFERQFVAAWAAFAGAGPEAGRGGARLLAAALQAQGQDDSRYRMPEILAALAPDFVRVAGEGPVRAAGEIAAAMKRLATALRLAPFGVKLWGDAGWRQAASPGVTYQGLAGHGAELNRIYAGTAVNVDLGRLYQQDIVTMRVFDVAACGRLVLAERSDDLETLFAVGQEVDCWSTPAELTAKVAYWLAHPAEAEALAARGREAILARHTVQHRVAHMLARCLG